MVSEKAFLGHIRENQGIIFKLVGLYAQDAEEKKDLCQEIIYQAWKGWPGFRGDAKFSTWLYRISLHTLLSYQRKRKPLQYTDDLEPFDRGIPEEVGLREDARLLYRAIRTLPEAERALITMHLDGYDNTEIAEIAGMTPNHVAVKLHRIRTKLSSTLNVK